MKHAYKGLLQKKKWSGKSGRRHGTTKQSIISKRRSGYVRKEKGGERGVRRDKKKRSWKIAMVNESLQFQGKKKIKEVEKSREEK